MYLYILGWDIGVLADCTTIPDHECDSTSLHQTIINKNNNREVKHSLMHALNTNFATLTYIQLSPIISNFEFRIVI